MPFREGVCHLLRQVRCRHHSLAFAGVLLFAASARLNGITEGLPYVQHPDERTVVTLALTMLQNGDANPHRFNYPSLPIYLILFAFLFGGAVAILFGKARGLADLGKDAGQFYRIPFAAWLAKALFAALSVGSLAITGLVGASVTRRRATLWLAPLVACLSFSYYRLSWLYLNVDILGAFFAMCTIGALFAFQPSSRSRTSVRWRPLIPGMLAGLTIGSKYNLFPVVVPCVLWFWFYEREHFLSRVTLLVVATATAFFASTPYALIDWRAFLFGTLAEIRHYGQGTGRAGHIAPRGWPMLRWHMEHFAEAFGWLPLGVAVGGVILLAKRDPRRTLILFAYPVGLVLFMSAQRVFFERNVVSVHLFIAIALAEGVLAIHDAVLNFGSKLSLGKTLLTVAATALPVVAVFAGIPWGRVFWAYGTHIEPRNQAVRWVRDLRKPGDTVLVDAAVKLDRRTLGSAFKVLETGGADELTRVSVPHGQTAVVIQQDSMDDYLHALPGSTVGTVFPFVSRVSPTRGINRSASIAVIVF